MCVYIYIHIGPVRGQVVGAAAAAAGGEDSEAYKRGRIKKQKDVMISVLEG